MATWPTTLPKPSADSYSITPSEQSIRTDMDAGAARVRRRSSARNDQVTVQWVFTDSQMAAFRTWFDSSSEAAGGSAWFTGLSLAMGDGGLTSEECRFVGAFSANSLDGKRWQVTAKLEVR